jgi:hypothetical protein
VPQHEGFEPYRGRLPIPQGLFPRPTQVADRCIVDGRHRHRGEVPGAHEPGQWQGITPVGCDAVTGFFGIKEGATTPQTSPCFIRKRESH